MNLMLSYSMPHVPAEIIPSSVIEEPLFFVEANKLWKEVVAEVLDEEFLSRRHENTGTYDKGCRGPLCRKSYREHPRRRGPLDAGELPPRYERAFDPVLEYFHTVIKHRVRSHQLLARQTG